MPNRGITRLKWVLPLILAGALALAGCGDDTEDATPSDQVPIGSPTSAADLPEDVGRATLEISDGELDVDRLELVAGRPTVLTVTNDDDAEYTLSIDSLVTDAVLPANDTMAVEFTTPTEGEFEATLMSGGEELNTFTVVVSSAPGVP